MTAIARTCGSELATERSEDFRTSEDLRCVLCRLDEEGPDAWVHDRVAAELMAYVCQRYAGLASKRGLDPWEAASAAFDVMRTRAVREARDPWAVVTRGADHLHLRGTRPRTAVLRPPGPPGPHLRARRSGAVHRSHVPARGRPSGVRHHRRRIGQLAGSEPESSTADVEAAVEDAIELLVLLGWPPETARGGVEHVCDALVRMGSRGSAFETLRHDAHACALLDVPPRSWRALLRALLGSPSSATTSADRGVLVRLLIGETIPALLADDDLVLALSVAPPGLTR